jgi:hypothetical protein
MLEVYFILKLMKPLGHLSTEFHLILVFGYLLLSLIYLEQFDEILKQLNFLVLVEVKFIVFFQQIGSEPWT